MKKLIPLMMLAFLPLLLPQVQASPVPPSNDACADADGPLAVPSTTFGSTLFATDDSSQAGLCGTSIGAPGVWYTVIGTGNTMTATTCSGFFDYDTKLNVYCADCGDLLCLGGNDDSSCGISGLLSTVSWCSQASKTYRILVQGFGFNTGDFELSVGDDGTPCTADVDCGPDVKIDLKPGSNPNCVNPGNKGRVPVATYGTPDFDVSTIDPSTVVFGGASALRCSANKDVLMEGPTSVFTKDGITDLVCHFRTRDVSWPTDGSDCGYLQFVAALFDGTSLQETELACLAGEPACEAETTSFGPVREDLTPCTPNVVDTWHFAVKAGQTVVARGDTVDAATAADLFMTLTCGSQSDSGDDEVACTFPPPAFACPLATLTATSNTLCTVDFTTFPGNCTDNAIANYELSVEVDGIGAFLELVGDDQ